MVDADGRDGGARVPTAAFSRLSATNVLFGWTWPQIGVGLAGLVMVVGGAAAGMVLPLMLAGGVVMAYGLIRYEGLSLMAVLLQCLFDRFGSVFPQCGLMVFPGVVIVSR